MNSKPRKNSTARSLPVKLSPPIQGQKRKIVSISQTFCTPRKTPDSSRNHKKINKWYNFHNVLNNNTTLSLWIDKLVERLGVRRTDKSNVHTNAVHNAFKCINTVFTTWGVGEAVTAHLAFARQHKRVLPFGRHTRAWPTLRTHLAWLSYAT